MLPAERAGGASCCRFRLLLPGLGISHPLTATASLHAQPSSAQHCHCQTPTSSHSPDDVSEIFAFLMKDLDGAKMGRTTYIAEHDENLLGTSLEGSHSVFPSRNHCATSATSSVSVTLYERLIPVSFPNDIHPARHLVAKVYRHQQHICKQGSQDLNN